MRLETTNSVIGARVLDVSLAEEPSQTVVDDIEFALEKHGVLIFPEQSITPQQQVAFSKAFAPLELTELEHARLAGHDEIFVVGNTGPELVTFSPADPNDELEWHTDHIHREVPARASLLHALEVPEQGGDTLFACMYSAYDSLSPQQQTDYLSLQMVHSASGLDRYLEEQGHASNDSNKKRSYRETVWPLVREHPLSKRRALYFGNQITIGVVGWEEHKARQFVRQLSEHACQPAFQYRHHWRAGDAVLWDNRRVLHAGTTYDTENSRRLMHRTTWRETESIEMVGNG